MKIMRQDAYSGTPYFAKRRDSNELNPRVDCVFLGQDKYGKGHIQKERR